MKKIKVLHLTFDMRIGGTEQVIKNLIESSNKDAFQSMVLCIESPIGPFGDMLKKTGITVHSLSRKQGFDSKLIGQIRSFIRHNDIDILHCHQYTPWVYGCLSALGQKCKVIFTEHGRFYPDRTSWKRKVVNPILHRITDSVTTISNATKTALSEFEYIPNASTQVIYNGIIPCKADQAELSSLKKQFNVSEHEVILGTIARLDSIKNHLMMLDAFKLLLQRGINARLIIVGDGEMRTEIEARIKAHGIGDHVIMPGYIASPNAYLALFDIYLLSSLSEGTSMTLLEAMSMRKPCVVTDAGGNAEIIENEVNGLVTENNNAQKFSEAIVTLSKSLALRQNYGQAGFKRFQQQFTTAFMTTEYESLYQSLATELS